MQQNPLHCTSVLCIAAQSDHRLLREWEKQLLPLEQAGYLTIWSELHLSAGSEQKQIIGHIAQANLIVLLLSSDFFDSQDCLALMKSALQRFSDGQTHIFLLWLRPVLWNVPPLKDLPALPTNGIPVTLWSSCDAAFQDCVKSISSFLNLPVAATQTNNIHLRIPPRPKQRLSKLYPSEAKQRGNYLLKYMPRMLLAIVVTLTLLFSVIAAGFITLNPSWCLLGHCSLHSSTLSTKLTNESLTVMLANAPQTSFYVYISPRRPSDVLSAAIGATYANGTPASYPYHIVLVLHNLRTQGIGLTIAAIDLFVTQIHPFPSHPLKVWANPNQLVNASPNRYVGQYQGQLAGDSISTTYERFYNGLGYFHLNPQETDQVDIQITSRIEVYMAFSFHISYRLDDSPQVHTLIFPSPSQSFQVAFATKDDWYLCAPSTSGCL